MTILYEDSLYPGTKKKYQGKTIGEIITTSLNPKAFVKAFNCMNNKFCLSDELIVDIKQPTSKFRCR